LGFSKTAENPITITVDRHMVIRADVNPADATTKSK
jgi:hypothetical protein